MLNLRVPTARERRLFTSGSRTIMGRNHSPKIVEIRIDPDILIIVEEKMSERKYMVRAECPWYSVLIKKLSLSLLWDQAQGEVGGRA